MIKLIRTLFSVECLQEFSLKGQIWQPKKPCIKI